MVGWRLQYYNIFVIRFCVVIGTWLYRKLCRNCKCKKEEHDVRDDEGYEQFEILFANSVTGKKKRTGACKFRVC